MFFPFFKLYKQNQIANICACTIDMMLKWKYAILHYVRQKALKKYILKLKKGAFESFFDISYPLFSLK